MMAPRPTKPSGFASRLVRHTPSPIHTLACTTPAEPTLTHHLRKKLNQMGRRRWPTPTIPSPSAESSRHPETPPDHAVHTGPAAYLAGGRPSPPRLAGLTAGCEPVHRRAPLRKLARPVQSQNEVYGQQKQQGPSELPIQVFQTLSKQVDRGPRSQHTLSLSLSLSLSLPPPAL